MNVTESNVLLYFYNTIGNTIVLTDLYMSFYNNKIYSNNLISRSMSSIFQSNGFFKGMKSFFSNVGQIIYIDTRTFHGSFLTSRVLYIIDGIVHGIDHV